MDARTLHGKLGSKRQFGNWVEDRLVQCRFVEGVDFTQFNKNVKSAPKARKEYWLTLEAAKQIAMMERTEVGFAMRQYMIEAEKSLRVVNPYLANEAMKKVMTRMKAWKKLGRSDQWIAVRAPLPPST